MKQPPSKRPRKLLLDLAAIGFLCALVLALGYFAFRETFLPFAGSYTAGSRDLTSPAMVGPADPAAAHHHKKDAATPMPQLVALPGTRSPKAASLGAIQGQASARPSVIALRNGGALDPRRASVAAAAMIPMQVQLQRAAPQFAAAAPGPGEPSVLTVGDPTPAGAGMSRLGPDTPAIVASTFTLADKFLVDWLRDWEKERATGVQVDPAAADVFAKLLSEANITLDQSLLLMKSVARLEIRANDEQPLSNDSPYPTVTAVLARQIVIEGAKEVEAVPEGREEILKKIAPLVKRLWMGPPQDLGAVEDFYTALAVGQLEGSPDWIRGNLGRAEAIGEQNRPDESIRALDGLIGELSGMEE